MHGDKKLHYMVEFHDAGILDVTHGEYSYTNTPECVQFIRNQRLIDNYDNNHIYNVIRNINTWTPETRIFSNYYIPNNIQQRQITLFIPRYSMESFYDKEFGDDHEMQLSGIKYIITAYTYIAGVKVVLGSYLFDLGSARATNGKVRYKMDDFQLCVDFDIIDPISLTYNDEWIGFRKNICHEPENINNTGAVMHVELDPVIQSEEGNYYIRSTEFLGGITSRPIAKKSGMTTFLQANLTFNGDADLRIKFNDVYEGDINLYLAETYGMWELDEDGNIIMDEDDAPVPRDNRAIFEIVIRDKENVYFEQSKLLPLTPNSCNWKFTKNKISQTWDWYKDGLILQGSVEIYDVYGLPQEDVNDIDALRSKLIPVVDLVSNEIPLNMETYKYLVNTSLLPNKKSIDLNSINMNTYEVSVVNKIHKDVVKINRPEDYKSNIVRPVFIRTEPLGDITIHPAVSENIAINLNKYKSKVDIFYLRIEGIDFIEIGRTPISVVFGVDGHLLPNEVTEGIAYILDENFKLVTTTRYKYEQ